MRIAQGCIVFGHTPRSLTSALLISYVAFACHRNVRRTADDTVVVILNEPEITELDPRYLLTTNDAKVSRLVHASLISVDQSALEPQLDLAAAVERRNPVTWDVTLRQDAKFSNGTPVTAADVAYTFATVLDPARRSLHRAAFAERLGNVEALSDQVVRFHLKAPLATFLTDLDFGIVAKHAAEQHPSGRFPDGNSIGAGPFHVVALKSGEVILERNNFYYGGVPPMQRVVLRTIRDANARLLVMAGGAADITQNTVRADLVADVQKSPRLKIQRGPSVNLTYLLFNHEDPLLRDVRVRQAIAYAIPREQIIRAKLGGLAVLATGLLPPTHWAYSGDVPRYEHNPTLAQQLLDQAGYPDPDGPGGKPRFSLTYKTSADAFRVGIARIIAQALREVGIAVEVRSFEFATFFSDVKQGNFQLASMQTSEIIEPDMHYIYFHSARIPTRAMPDLHNRFRYRNLEVDRLTIAGRHELDLEKRKQIYADLQNLIATDLPMFPLWHEDNVVVANIDIDGYEVLPNARLSPLAKVRKRTQKP